MSGPVVIVASHNQAAALERLLESLGAQTVEHAVVVVDNGSTDSTAVMLGRRSRQIRSIRFEQNVGFGRAVNEAVRSCPYADPLVLVNDDTVCEPQFVERMCGALAPAEGIVMAAGVLLQYARPERIDSAGIVFDRTLLAVDYLHGQPVSSLADALDPMGPTGGAAAFHRSAFEAVGGFDERFFAYLEDVDLVARMLARGGRCRLAPDARALHRHAATLGSGSRRKNELMGWGRGYIVGKYRVHRRPALIARSVLGELAIAMGQLFVDGTTVGFGARVRGFRAGCQAPEHELPPIPAGTCTISLGGALRQRFRRAAERGVQLRS